MHEISFATKTKKTTTKKEKNSNSKKHFIPENALFYTHSLNTLPQNTTPPFFQQNHILPEGHFIVTPLHFKKIVLTTFIRHPIIELGRVVSEM